MTRLTPASAPSAAAAPNDCKPDAPAHRPTPRPHDPRSHSWPGSINPPSSPSANRHAAPRAHRTVPDATRARHTARRCCWSRYFTRPTASRTRSPQTGEQNFWCQTLGTYSHAAQLAEPRPRRDPPPPSPAADADTPNRNSADSHAAARNAGHSAYTPDNGPNQPPPSGERNSPSGAWKRCLSKKRGSARGPWPVAPAVTTSAEAFERPVRGGEMVWPPCLRQVDGVREALAVGADPAVAVEDHETSFAPGCAGSAGAFLAGSFAAEGAAGRLWPGWTVRLRSGGTPR